ncbi:AraC-like DNA-binding protein [Paenibacillus cellulosilyticus]|uniref:AraC-like DNA-binding protein n=2 Tax=Paenibacillus cellulosilyticus TaxID=375489 RepID=A0A2V2YYK5_9BACL|nr:AraC-like DNA-binding protein [Paenibacillus cellulosilyticus]
MVTIQGIAFIPQNISKGGEKLYILNKQDVPIVDGLINLNSDSSQANLSEAQQQLDLLWNKLDLIEMNDELKAISPAMAQGKIDKRLIIVHRYIRLNYGEPLTLQLLADLINCNPVYLSNTYTKLFKITPMKYLQVTRMKKASELLKETNMSIKDITTHLGYVNNSQFSTIFKRYFSCTPVEYRRNQHLQMRSIGIF